MNDKEILQLVILAAEGKDDIRKGAIGYGGYGFIFRDEDFFKDFSKEIFRYRAFVEVGDENCLRKDRKEGKFDIDKIDSYYLINALMIGSLKTLLPSLKFMEAEYSDILFVVWVIIRTPKGKIFSAIYHYDRYRMALGNLRSREKFCEKYPYICNYDPKNLSREEKYELADAFENALKKVPLTDYRTIYPGHDYAFHIGVNNKVPLFEIVDWDDEWSDDWDAES